VSAAADDLALLVERASRGEALAFETLLERYLPRLRAFVRLRCGAALRERESASDLVQSVCRDVLQNLDGFRYQGEAEFRSWLFTAAARKVADRAEHWQAARRDVAREQPIVAGSDGALLEIYRQTCSPSQAAMGREALERVEAAFDELPDDYREAVVLSRVLGLPRAEVARAMGRSEDSVRHLLFRGLSQLASKLAG
jgi:RNA polymerase sigma-70 factor, ECF subfamily